MMEPVNPSHPTKIHHDTTETAGRGAFLATFPFYLCYHSGAGKTTFAKEYLPREAACPNFINADLIAAGLSPFDPAGAAVQAGRLMIREMRRYLRQGESFAFETTLAGRSYALHIPDWQPERQRPSLDENE